jgi:hypothetical protein
MNSPMFRQEKHELLHWQYEHKLSYVSTSLA